MNNIISDPMHVTEPIVTRAPEPDWSGWENWLRSHLDIEREVTIEAFGEARWNNIQLVAMYLSPPFGMFPRWVCVKAVGAINSEPVLGAIFLLWYRNSVSPS